MHAIRPLLPVVVFLFAGIPISGSGTARAQGIFNAVTGGPGGTASGLFQVVNGQVSPIASGVAQNSFPSLSRDGRFVTFADTDTFRPAQTSTDLYLFDRVTGQTRRIIDYTTEALQDGSFATSLPQFSALSPNNLFVALTTQVLITTNNAGSSSTPILGVYRVSDGLQLSVAEFGQGNALDFFRSEHVGITWTPDGSAFATPVYVPAATQSGRPGAASVGIGLFSVDAAGRALPVRPLTQPRVFDLAVPNVIETHIFPSISPDGRRLAYFEITWPDALLQGPAAARLIAMDLGSGNAAAVTGFNPGFLPMGLSWTPDGSQLVFSIARQAANPFGQGFASGGDPATAVIRAVNAAGGQPFSIAGVDAGYFPGFSAGTPVIDPPTDMSGVSLDIAGSDDGGLVLRASGLDPDRQYRLESSPDLQTWDNHQDFTGQQFAAGIRITPGQGRRFFRATHVP